MNYTLQSCDESSYPSISNLCWVGSHPYEGLFVSINQIFQGQPIDENKRYQLVLDAVGVCFENVPNLLVSEPQICDTSNGFLYRNCETGEEVVFFFALQDPIDNVLKIDGTCDCWELQGPGSPATVILYDNYSECDTCENCKTELCENGERTIGTAVVVELPDPPPPDRGFDKCCYNNLVLADLSDIDPYKNDFNGFFFKRQTPKQYGKFYIN